MNSPRKNCILTPLAILLASQSAFSYDKNNVVHCIGNAHIDTAWLWPKTEVQNQVIPDTYNNAINKMNANADYRSSRPI